jgi:aminoglycoside phosphotransferase (APT) family kinase protein
MPVLPRVLANLISLVRTGKPARRYQHTIQGYRKLLRQSGFEQIEFVAFHQDDNLCEVIRPGPGQFPFWSPPPCSGWKQKIKQTAFFAPNFGILARKQIRRNPSLEESLVDYIVHELGLKREHVQTKHYLVSPKGKLIVRAMCGEQELYIRLPLNDQATGAERRNHTRLEWLKEHRRGMVGYFPNPILKGCVAGKEFFVESAVYGTPILNLLKKQRSASDSLRMGMDLLVDLAEPSTATQPHLDGQAYERLVSKPLQALATLITPDEMTRLQEFFKVRLEDRQLPRGLLHGDFSARNILAERGAVSGLLDWEESDTDGIPALDAICLTLSCYRRLGTETDRGDSLLDLARRRGYFGDYLKELDLYYRRTGTDESCHEGLVSLFWIQVMSHRVRLGRTVRNTSDERYVKHVVAQMLEL